jgi:hypothetical protein
VASPESRAFDDPGIFVEIPLVNQIRPRVKAWREAGYPGITSITKRLLEYWCDPEEFETRRFFFCQLEAVETLIWLTKHHLLTVWVSTSQEMVVILFDVAAKWRLVQVRPSSWR